MGACKGKFNVHACKEIMKYTYFFIFVAILLNVSCGGAAETTKNAPGQNVNTAAGTNTGQTGGPATEQANGESVAPPGSVFDKSNRERALVDSNPGGTPPPPQFRKAGDDSEIAVTMKADGSVLEIRRFKSHPQLSRVEATWNGTGPKSLKYFLKGGKVVTASSDRIANLQTAPLSVLLEIAGIQPPPPPPPTSGATEKKPSQ